MSHEKFWTCPHDGRQVIQAGPGDPFTNNNAPVKQAHEYVCPFCGNRMTPPGGLFTEGGARNVSTPGSEREADGVLSTLTSATDTFSAASTDLMTITLTAPAVDGGLTVTLTSSVPAKMTVPASVVVPGGATTKTFLATGVAAGASTITASAVGSTNKTKALTAT